MDTPGIVREGQKYYAEEESAAAAMMQQQDDISQAYTLEGLGASVNRTSELDMGLKTVSIGNSLTIEDGVSTSKSLNLAIIALIVYFLFIKKGKRK